MQCVSFNKDILLGVIEWHGNNCQSIVLTIQENTTLPIRHLIRHDDGRPCMVELEWTENDKLYYAWVGNSQYPINLITVVEQEKT